MISCTLKFFWVGSVQYTPVLSFYSDVTDTVKLIKIEFSKSLNSFSRSSQLKVLQIMVHRD